MGKVVLLRDIALKLFLSNQIRLKSNREKAKMRRNREPIPYRWELIQSVCFSDDIFLCLLRGQDEKYFSFIAENSKIKNFHKFKELKKAQKHFLGLLSEISKDKRVGTIIPL